MEEASGHLMFQEAPPVLGEIGMVEGGVSCLVADSYFFNTLLVAG